MGGMGSGGRNRTHGTVEDYERIDSFELGRYLDAAEEPHEIYDPVFYGAYRFALHWVDGVDGSPSRLYFGCPRCRRRVRYLYRRGSSYACRKCLGANYASQQATKGSIDEVRRRMRELVEKDLGYTWWKRDHPDTGIEELDIIPKPRYMRWAKYSALMIRYRDLQDEYWRAFFRMVGVHPDLSAYL